MVNNIEFSNRLKILMDYYELTATSLADSIEVQRSSISHLLSGRNKPSLDFVMKILKKYPEVELYWLLNGKGSFPTTTSPILQNKKETTLPFEKADEEKTPLTKEDDVIEKIVIFYKNGTFKSYTP